MREFLFIAAGGAIGAVARYLLSLGAHRLLGDGFPYGTLLVDLLGCFALGLFAQSSLAFHEPQALQRGVAVGFLGALTTFSTFGYETFRRSEEGQWSIAIGNVAANLTLGLLAVWLGVALGRWLFAVQPYR